MATRRSDARSPAARTRSPFDPCAWFGETNALLPASRGPRGGAATRLLTQPSDFGWLPEMPARLPTDDGQAPHLAELNALGLDGYLDAHTHWFPDNVNAKIWAYFDRHYWPVTYRESTERRVEWMRRNGARRFTTLTYAHRPGMAEWLNDWTHEFCARVPEAIPCATFYPEPEAAAYVRRAIEQHRARGFKLHMRVGDFDPALEALDGAFEQVAAAALPVVMHVGGAPDPGPFTVPQVVERLLLRHPNLRLIIAHMGAREFDHYLRLAETHPNVALDTTMVFVGFDACDPYPASLMARLEAISDRVLFGSDFPTIPYPLSHALRSFFALPLSDTAKRRMLWDNAAQWFGIAVS